LAVDDHFPTAFFSMKAIMRTSGSWQGGGTSQFSRGWARQTSLTRDAHPLSERGTPRASGVRFKPNLCSSFGPKLYDESSLCDAVQESDYERKEEPEVDPTEALRRLEAVLFLSREPLNTRRLAQFADLSDGGEARRLTKILNRRYDERGCAFHAIEVGGGFQLMSRPQFAPWLRRLHQETVEVRLSPAAMETLAIIAYQQPVLRATVESIRGVQCGEILRQLLDRDLVRIVGRSDELGRPFLYGTTKYFLRIFGLRHIDQLPEGIE
jgi:segregation and condensation protein B